MIIEFRPEQAQIIEQAISAGLIRGVDDAVNLGLEKLKAQLESWKPAEAQLTAEQWKAELHCWVESHSSTTALLSDEAVSRESIYAERGL